MTQLRLPARDPVGHKGTFGTVCVLGGQCAAPRVMIGGPAFSAMAALRAGAGLAVLAMPEPLIRAALTIAPSATGLALPVDASGHLLPAESARILDEHLSGRVCLAIGPGWGTGEAQSKMLARIVAMEGHPIVLDADGLNTLAGIPHVQRDFRAAAVLTPHPGEYSRLARALGVSAPDQTVPTDPSAREHCAIELAQRLGAVVVLKGSGTVITDGQQTTVNDTGNAALATAGTGDVLTGIIAGFIAQFPELDLYDAARIAVHVHGLAADRWVADHGPAGLLATDLLDALPMTLADRDPD